MLQHILENESLTRGLGDAEARILVEWLVDRAEELAEQDPSGEEAQGEVWKLCRRGRAIGRFVSLWCYGRAYGPAGQLAAAERFYWPMPAASGEPCEIMQAILIWESDHPEYGRR